MKETFIKIFGLFVAIFIILLFIIFIIKILPTDSLAQIFMMLPLGLALHVIATMIGGLLMFAIIYMFPIFGIFLLISISIFLPLFFIFL